MKKTLNTIFITAVSMASLLSFVPAIAAPVRLEFAGYLGNPSNIRVDASETYGVGPVYDEATGLLFASAGTGRINAYRLDGTQEATYTLPEAKPFRRFDCMVHCQNGTILILAGGSEGSKSKGAVYRIRIGAPDGTEAERVTAVKTISGMAMSAREGKVILHSSEGTFLELDSTTLLVREIGPAPGGTIGDGYYFCMLDWGLDGDLYWLHRHSELHKFALRDGQLIEVLDKASDWPREIQIGLTRGCFIGEDWWVLSGGDTIKRWNARTFAPNPGVVHGGTSGSFLGKVDRNAEMQLDGICKIREDLYAVTARNNGAIYILKWNPETLHLDEVRRIGAVPEPQVLMLDPKGMVYVENLVWNFEDDALAVPRFTYDTGRNFVGTFLNNGVAVVAAFQRNQLAFRDGRLDQEMETRDRQISGADFNKDTALAGTFIGKSTSGTVALIRVGTDAKGTLFTLNANGNIRKDIAPHPISFMLSSLGSQETLPKQISSLVGLPDGMVLAVADGQLIVFAPREDGNYQKTRVLNIAVSPDSAIAVDGGRICLVDPASGLLRLIDAKTGAVLTTQTGLERPTRVAFSNGRICVYESGAQRISKFIVR